MKKKELNIGKSSLGGMAKALEQVAFETSHAAREKEWVFLDTVLDQMPVGVLIIDAVTQRILLKNKKFDEVTRMPPITYYREYEKYYTPLRKDGTKYAMDECPIIRSITFNETIIDEIMIFQHRDGTRLALSVNSAPIIDKQGKVIAGVALYGDVTARAAGATHVEFLAQASTILASSLDRSAIMEQIAELVVAHIADGCTIDLLNGKGGIEPAAMVYKDPAKKELALAIRNSGYLDLNAIVGVGVAIRAGRSILYHKIRPAAVRQLVPDEPYTELLSRAGIRSVMIVPIKIRNAVAGAMTFVSTHDDALFDKEHLKLAEELSKRVAVTLDNMLLYSNARRAIELRDDLISMASHELRTPITSMVLNVYVLRKKLEAMHQTDIAAQAVDIDRQLWELSKLIDTLLDVTRIQGGKLECQKANFDMNELIQEIAQKMQNTTNRHHIVVRGDVGIVYADRTRIGHVLSNLLGNAIKYSNGGDIVITSANEHDTHVFSVQDAGMGIAQEHVHKIFDRFYRVQDPKNKTYPGLGIGLYIASEIVKDHGGTIWVESEQGKGSTFFFTIPSVPNGVV